MKKKYDIAVGLFFLGLSIFAYWEVHDLQPVVSSGNYGPDLFPKLVSIGMAICSFIVLLQGIFIKESANIRIFDFRDPGTQRALKLICIVIVFIFLLYLFGFFPAAILMISSVVILLGERCPSKVIMITACILLGVFIVFKLLLKVNLPGGILF